MSFNSALTSLLCDNSSFIFAETSMTDQSPESLTDIEILDILQSMKKDELDVEAKEIIRKIVTFSPFIVKCHFIFLL